MSKEQPIDTETQAFQDEVGAYLRGETKPEDPVMMHLVTQFQVAQQALEKTQKQAAAQEQQLTASRQESLKLAGRVDGLAVDMRHFWQWGNKAPKRDEGA